MASHRSLLTRFGMVPSLRRSLPARWDRRRLLALAALVILVATATGLLGYDIVQRRQHYTKLEAIPPGSILPVPRTSPVIVIMFENKGETEVLSASDAPTFNSLAAKGALSVDYQAIAHPSQPNYLALFSGSPQAVFDDGNHDITAPTLADQIEAAGKTWRVFAENVPATPCYTGPTATGGPDGGTGEYVRKHNPAISFTAIHASPTRCANIQPLSAFSPDAADFIWVVPNMCNIMHDCPVATGDAWLKAFAPKILDSAAFQPGGSGVLYVTFDEASDRSRNNEIRTVVVGPQVKQGFQTDVAHNHYSLLRTIETGLGLPCLASACDANTLGEVFTSGG